ncbi:MAG TPA: hypothetical protein VGO98_01905 [Candidatus Saccharimonadales bacterium]|jgi:uncharacterized protein with PQ loop repeat|nr:hypothetical protein [Candidatus Saccharimonadales bacterium]
MSRQNHLLHFHISKKKRINLFDKIIIVAAFMYPLSGLPQIVTVFSGNTDGVSLISWISLLCFSILFLMYGLMHQIKPMIITNGLWIVVDGLVIVGILANGVSIA